VIMVMVLSVTMGSTSTPTRLLPPPHPLLPCLDRLHGIYNPSFFKTNLSQMMKGRRGDLERRA